MNISRMLLAIGVLSLFAAQASAEAVIQTKIINVEKSQNIMVNGACLRASIFGEEGPFPVGASVGPCTNSTWHPYRFLFEPRTFGGGRYFLIHPRSRPDLCLGIEDAAINQPNPQVTLNTCGNYVTLNGVRVKLASENTKQLWGVMPVNNDYEEGLHVITNARLSGVSAGVDNKAIMDRNKTRPRVMTSNLDVDGTVIIADYVAADGQLPKRTQHWSSQEIHCVVNLSPIVTRHAYGREVGGAGASGQSIPINNPNCVE